MQAVSYTCEDCKERIEDQENPVLVYIVAGLAPLHPVVRAGGGHADVTDFPLSQTVRDILAQPIARRDYCAPCFARAFSLPLVGPDGKEVA